MPPVAKKFIRGRFVPPEDNTVGGVLLNTQKKSDWIFYISYPTSEYDQNSHVDYMVVFYTHLTAFWQLCLTSSSVNTESFMTLYMIYQDVLCDWSKKSNNWFETSDPCVLHDHLSQWRESYSVMSPSRT